MRAYARGYYIKNDYYNGINYAFMLDVRAAATSGDEALTDRVLARRRRREVLEICDRLLTEGPAPVGEEVFWIGATKVEALFGLGQRNESGQLKSEILAKERERLKQAGASSEDANAQVGWMEASLVTQLDKLAQVLPAA